MSFRKGYTLIELTVVVGLTSLLAIAITAILMSSLLSSKRISNLAHLRQTGDYALNQIQQLIRNAQTINSCSSSTNTLTLTNQDGGQTTLSPVDIGNNLFKIASSSSSQTLYLNSDQSPASSFSLTCQPNDTNPTLVQVSFTLTTNSADTRPFAKPNINFETSVELRNQ